MESSASALIYREATVADVEAMVRCREGDPTIGPADPRMANYLNGTHHPQQALFERVIFICLEEETVVGYIGGHLTRRYDCDGELQYLYVAHSRRKRGIARELLARLNHWFLDRSVARVCVDVEPVNADARAFYGNAGAVVLNEHWMVWRDFSVSSPSMH
jgi:GNAT superfamily N-acetyltransferase